MYSKVRSNDVRAVADALDAGADAGLGSSGSGTRGLCFLLLV